jgi:hypothetical protein
MSQATYDDANLLLRLYELRRDPKMREARSWFMANFKPKTMADVQALCPPGSEPNAMMRMVSTYWDMAASFIVAGVLNPDLFFMNNKELLLVSIRMGKVLDEVRVAYKDSTYLKNLETVGKQYGEWMEKQSPGALQAFTARVGG